MSDSKMRDPTTAEEALGVAPGDAALSGSLDSVSNGPLGDKADKDPDPQLQLEATRMGATLQCMSTKSCDEIDGLMRDLHSLREKLVLDGERIEQAIEEFVRFNQSVLTLTEVLSDGAAQIKADNPGTE